MNINLSNRSIKLPVATLLKQYKDNQNKLVRHFDLLYIQQGVNRLPVNVSYDMGICKKFAHLILPEPGTSRFAADTSPWPSRQLSGVFQPCSYFVQPFLEASP